MSTYFGLRDGSMARIIMPEKQALRLRGTCFRGPHCPKAGNFFAWQNFAEFINDSETRNGLTHVFEYLIKEGGTKKPHRFELFYEKDVGWDSVIATDELTTNDLKSCKLGHLNKRTTALFLPENRILAPRTDVVTMVVTVYQGRYWNFTIRTMYPGPDIGELNGGNLTELDGIVILPWSNQGA